MQAVGNKRFVARAFLVSLSMVWGAAMAAPQYRLVELPFSGPPDDPYNDTSAVAINRIGDTAVDFLIYIALIQIRHAAWLPGSTDGL